MDLTADEEALANRIGFDVEICKLVKRESMQALKQTVRVGDDLEVVAAQGLCVSMTPDGAQAFIDKFQADLLSRSYRGFWSQDQGGSGSHQDDELVVLKTTDQFEIVRLRHTDGVNYDISHSAVLRKLRSWLKICEFNIIGASHDWVALKFEALPVDICTFAKQVYKFCPDTVEQGVGLWREQEHPAKFAAARELCPDVKLKDPVSFPKFLASFEQLHTIAAEAVNTRTSDIHVEPQIGAESREALQKLYNMLKAKERTDSSMGVKLLAHEIRESRDLFLWWD